LEQRWNERLLALRVVEDGSRPSMRCRFEV
jgi:hypothetical protein